MAAVFNDVSRLDLVIPHGADLGGVNGMTLSVVDANGAPVNLSSGWTASLKIGITYDSTPIVTLTQSATSSGSITLGNGFVVVKLKSAALSSVTNFLTGVWTLDLTNGAAGTWRILTGAVRLSRRVS